MKAEEVVPDEPTYEGLAEESETIIKETIVTVKTVTTERLPFSEDLEDMRDLDQEREMPEAKDQEPEPLIEMQLPTRELVLSESEEDEVKEEPVAAEVDTLEGAKEILTDYDEEKREEEEPIYLDADETQEEKVDMPAVVVTEITKREIADLDESELKDSFEPYTLGDTEDIVEDLQQEVKVPQELDALETETLVTVQTVTETIVSHPSEEEWVVPVEDLTEPRKEVEPLPKVEDRVPSPVDDQVDVDALKEEFLTPVDTMDTLMSVSPGIVESETVLTEVTQVTVGATPEAELTEETPAVTLTEEEEEEERDLKAEEVVPDEPTYEGLAEESETIIKETIVTVKTVTTERLPFTEDLEDMRDLDQEREMPEAKDQQPEPLIEMQLPTRVLVLSESEEDAVKEEPVAAEVDTLEGAKEILTDHDEEKREEEEPVYLDADETQEEKVDMPSVVVTEITKREIADLDESELKDSFEPYTLGDTEDIVEDLQQEVKVPQELDALETETLVTVQTVTETIVSHPSEEEWVVPVEDLTELRKEVEPLPKVEDRVPSPVVDQVDVDALKEEFLTPVDTMDTLMSVSPGIVESETVLTEVTQVTVGATPEAELTEETPAVTLTEEEEEEERDLKAEEVVPDEPTYEGLADESETIIKETIVTVKTVTTERLPFTEDLEDMRDLDQEREMPEAKDQEPEPLIEMQLPTRVLVLSESEEDEVKEEPVAAEVDTLEGAKEILTDYDEEKREEEEPVYLDADETQEEKVDMPAVVVTGITKGEIADLDESELKDSFEPYTLGDTGDIVEDLQEEVKVPQELDALETETLVTVQTVTETIVSHPSEEEWVGPVDDLTELRKEVEPLPKVEDRVPSPVDDQVDVDALKEEFLTPFDTMDTLMSVSPGIVESETVVTEVTQVTVGATPEAKLTEETPIVTLTEEEEEEERDLKAEEVVPDEPTYEGLPEESETIIKETIVTVKTVTTERLPFTEDLEDMRDLDQEREMPEAKDQEPEPLIEMQLPTRELVLSESEEDEVKEEPVAAEVDTLEGAKEILTDYDEEKREQEEPVYLDADETQEEKVDMPSVVVTEITKREIADLDESELKDSFEPYTLGDTEDIVEDLQQEVMVPQELDALETETLVTVQTVTETIVSHPSEEEWVGPVDDLTELRKEVEPLPKVEDRMPELPTEMTVFSQLETEICQSSTERNKMVQGKDEQEIIPFDERETSQSKESMTTALSEIETEEEHEISGKGGMRYNVDYVSQQTRISRDVDSAEWPNITVIQSGVPEAAVNILGDELRLLREYDEEEQIQGKEMEMGLTDKIPLKETKLRVDERLGETDVTVQRLSPEFELISQPIDLAEIKLEEINVSQGQEGPSGPTVHPFITDHDITEQDWSSVGKEIPDLYVQKRKIEETFVQDRVRDTDEWVMAEHPAEMKDPFEIDFGKGLAGEPSGFYEEMGMTAGQEDIPVGHEPERAEAHLRMKDTDEWLVPELPLEVGVSQLTETSERETVGISRAKDEEPEGLSEQAAVEMPLSVIPSIKDEGNLSEKLDPDVAVSEDSESRETRDSNAWEVNTLIDRIVELERDTSVIHRAPSPTERLQSQEPLEGRDLSTLPVSSDSHIVEIVKGTHRVKFSNDLWQSSERRDRAAPDSLDYGSGTEERSPYGRGDAWLNEIITSQNEMRRSELPQTSDALVADTVIHPDMPTPSSGLAHITTDTQHAAPSQTTAFSLPLTDGGPVHPLSVTATSRDRELSSGQTVPDDTPTLGREDSEMTFPYRYVQYDTLNVERPVMDIVEEEKLESGNVPETAVEHIDRNYIADVNSFERNETVGYDLEPLQKYSKTEYTEKFIFVDQAGHPKSDEPLPEFDEPIDISDKGETPGRIPYEERQPADAETTIWETSDVEWVALTGTDDLPLLISDRDKKLKSDVNKAPLEGEQNQVAPLTRKTKEGSPASNTSVSDDDGEVRPLLGLWVTRPLGAGEPGDGSGSTEPPSWSPQADKIREEPEAPATDMHQQGYLTGLTTPYSADNQAFNIESTADGPVRETDTSMETAMYQIPVDEDRDTGYPRLPNVSPPVEARVVLAPQRTILVQGAESPDSGDARPVRSEDIQLEDKAEALAEDAGRGDTEEGTAAAAPAAAAAAATPTKEGDIYPRYVAKEESQPRGSGPVTVVSSSDCLLSFNGN